jgi:hypothetical protein
MCQQHWERVMQLIHEKQLPKHVNLLEVRAYMYACYLEQKITIHQWNEFEIAVFEREPSLLLVG